jgi:hypothetical protein
VLTLDEELTVGGSLAALFAVSTEWSFGVTGSIERIVPETGQAGVYGSGGLGLRWSPRFTTAPPTAREASAPRGSRAQPAKHEWKTARQGA